MAEHAAVNRGVMGSNPILGARLELVNHSVLPGEKWDDSSTGRASG